MSLKGILLRVCGDLVAASHDLEGAARLSVKQSHSESFKAAVRSYVRAYNKHHGAAVTVSFPKPFVVLLRDRPKTARPAPSGPPPAAAARR